MIVDLNHISFAEWLIELNACAAKAGYRGQPLTEISGQLCWYSAYEAGVLPQDALGIAEREGQEFGQYYYV